MQNASGFVTSSDEVVEIIQTTTRTVIKRRPRRQPIDWCVAGNISVCGRWPFCKCGGPPSKPKQ